MGKWFRSSKDNDNPDIDAENEISSDVSSAVADGTTDVNSTGDVTADVDDGTEEYEGSQENDGVARVDVLTEEAEIFEGVPDVADLSADEIELMREEVQENPQFHDIPEYLIDLSVIQGRVLPELVVPEWPDELEFAQQRIEPCDLTHHLAEVTYRRRLAARIEQLLLVVRVKVYERYLKRASRRFKDRLDEESTLNETLVSLKEWRIQQGLSVAWVLAARIDEEVQKALHAQEEAIKYVETQSTFRNDKAINFYRQFVGRAIFFPVFYLYLASVFALTFDWLVGLDTGWSRTPIVAQITDFFLDISLTRVLVILAALFGALWLANLWNYAKTVTRVQKQVIAFNKEYKKQRARIKWSVTQHTRLAQQQPYVKPLLEVLAKGYRLQLASKVGMEANVTTDFDVSTLPACVTVAKAVDTDEEKMNQIRVKALRYLLYPGWRTSGLNAIARYFAESRLLGSNNLDLSKLDTDSVVGANNARALLMEAFGDINLQNKVSRERLRMTIRNLHNEVITSWDSTYRPRVESTRDDGFDRASFATTWLTDEDVSEEWIEFLSEILGETTPFSQFNIQDKMSDLNRAERISSVAVVPHYFELSDYNQRVKVEPSTSKEITPIDVVVRVDVSPWSNPESFAVFADGKSQEVPSETTFLDEGGEPSA